MKKSTCPLFLNLSFTILLCLSACTQISSFLGGNSLQPTPLPTSNVPFQPPYVEKTEILKAVEITKNHIGIAFIGEASDETVQAIIRMLRSAGYSGSFFIPAIPMAEDPDKAHWLISAGFTLGNCGLKDDVSLTEEELLGTNIAHLMRRSSEIINEKAAVIPRLAYYPRTTYTDAMKDTAAGLGISGLVEPSGYINYHSFSSQQQVTDFVNRQDWGSILMVKLSKEISEDEFNTGRKAEERGIEEIERVDEEEPEDKEPTPLPTLATQAEKEKDLLQVLEWLVEGCKERNVHLDTLENILQIQEEDAANSAAIITAGIEKHARETAADPQDDLSEESRQMLYLHKTFMENARTTMPAAALVFDRVGSDEQVFEILQSLEKLGIHADFVFQSKDIMERKTLVQNVLDSGHEIINGGFSRREFDTNDVDAVIHDLSYSQYILQREFGLQTPFYRVENNSNRTDAILSAVDSIEAVYSLYNKFPQPQSGQTVEEVMEYFNQTIHRGDIINLPMNSYDKMPELLEAINALAKDIGYHFATISEMRDNEYPLVPLERIEGADQIKPNLDFDPYQPLDGFVYNYVPQKENEKYLYLSYDDWGSDKTINKLLDIMDQYHVKSEFFVRCGGAVNNPNEIRAIYERGHDVSNHTFAHTVITELSLEEIQTEVIKCYQIEALALGTAPTLHFRPPELSMDIAGLNAIRAVGYHYVVAGRSTTEDYKKTAEEVLENVRESITPGEFVVLHSLDRASAGEALGPILELAAEQGYEFKTISDVLGY